MVSGSSVLAGAELWAERPEVAAKGPVLVPGLPAAHD